LGYSALLAVQIRQMQIDFDRTGDLSDNRDAAKALGRAKCHKYILCQVSSEHTLNYSSSLWRAQAVHGMAPRLCRNPESYSARCAELAEAKTLTARLAH
jgi:hypothetical protein